MTAEGQSWQGAAANVKKWLSQKGTRRSEGTLAG